MLNNTAFLYHTNISCFILNARGSRDYVISHTGRHQIYDFHNLENFPSAEQANRSKCGFGLDKMLQGAV